MANPDPAIRAIIQAVHDTWPEWDLKFVIRNPDGSESEWKWDQEKQQPVRVTEGCDG